MHRLSLLLCLAACVPQGTDLGPAVVGVYLANETDVAGLFQLRSGMGIGVALRTGTVGEGRDDDEGLWVDGAELALRTDERWVEAPALAPGLHTTRFEDALQLPEQGQPVELEAWVDGQRLALSAEVPPVLRLPLAAYSVPRGEDLVVPLPDDWSDRYDHVVSHVLSSAGEVVWHDRPSTPGAWLDTFTDPPRPRRLTVPAQALQGHEELVLAVAFLTQLDTVAQFEGPLNEPVSGLWAGSSWLVPLRVTR
jgi:hypothetical protein